MELDSLAVVLVKDSGSNRNNPSGAVRLRNAFKILKFPDSHLYSADYPEQKRQWISVLEDTKRKYKAARAKMKNSHRKTSLEESITVNRQKTLKQKQLALLQEDWIKEMPEQLDVLIAQRDFEKAVEQVLNGSNECIIFVTINELNLMYIGRKGQGLSEGFYRQPCSERRKVPHRSQNKTAGRVLETGAACEQGSQSERRTSRLAKSCSAAPETGQERSGLRALPQEQILSDALRYEATEGGGIHRHLHRQTLSHLLRGTAEHLFRIPAGVRRGGF